MEFVVGVDEDEGISGHGLEGSVAGDAHPAVGLREGPNQARMPLRPVANALVYRRRTRPVVDQQDLMGGLLLGHQRTDALIQEVDSPKDRNSDRDSRRPSRS